jgi:hypothetical protein
MSELESPFEPLQNTPLLPSSEMDAVGEDVSGPLELTFTSSPESKYYKVDMSQIRDIEDVKNVLAALRLQCTDDVFEEFNIKHLKLSE